jgi:alkanesulfonate monooxygenase SsuD/methylene tetrahydromethanopterin reductase-like flavin-dependent oxidoreductase (luciferase family)
MPLDAPLRNPNAMKLGIFCLNVSNGTVAIMDTPHKILPTWDQNVRIAQAADAAGWEFLLPLGRWRGFDGPTNHNGRQFEVFTWAAGIGAVTSRIQVFATAHVPLVHPLMAAKQGATVDLISGGRFALNVVAGWNEAEMRMFGIEQRGHDERYEVAKEWTSLVARLWTDEEEFDFCGNYFDIQAGYLQPKPAQTPRPIIVNAGSSPAGMRFGAEFCDFSFQVSTDIDQLADLNIQARLLAAEHGRELGILSSGIVVCSDTEREARRQLDYFCDELGDWETANTMIDQIVEGGTRSLPVEYMRNMARHLVAGWGSFPLVGTPEQIVEQLLSLKKIGTDGMALSWFNYEEGLSQFNEQVLPLMVQAGLRVS